MLICKMKIGVIIYADDPFVIFDNVIELKPTRAPKIMNISFIIFIEQLRLPCMKPLRFKVIFLQLEAVVLFLL